MTPNPNIEGKTTQKPTEIDNATGKVVEIVFPDLPGKTVSEIKVVTEDPGKRIDVNGQLGYSRLIKSFINLETGRIIVVLAKYTSA